MPLIWGRNPVREAFRAGQRIERVYLAEGVKQTDVVKEIVEAAQQQGVPVQRRDRRTLDRLTGSVQHQGIVAEVEAYRYASFDDLLARGADLGEPPFLLLLDALQDPQNLGTLVRTAEAVGVHGIVLPRHRAVGVTPAVVKASAGAIAHVPVAQVPNIARAIDDLKQEGIWTVGLDAEADTPFDEVDLTGPIGIVVGAEGTGLGRLVKERCDLLIRLPMRGRVASLNAAVAGSIVVYHAWRERTKRAASGAATPPSTRKGDPDR